MVYIAAVCISSELISLMFGVTGVGSSGMCGEGSTGKHVGLRGYTVISHSILEIFNHRLIT